MPGNTKPFIRHADVQQALGFLGFPLIILDPITGLPTVSSSSSSASPIGDSSVPAIMDIDSDNDDQRHHTSNHNNRNQSGMVNANTIVIDDDDHGGGLEQQQHQPHHDHDQHHQTDDDNHDQCQGRSQDHTQLRRTTSWRRMGPKQLAALTVDDFKQMPGQQAAAVAAQTAIALQKQIGRNKLLMSRSKQLKRKCERTTDSKLKKLKQLEDIAKHESSLVLHTKGKSGRRLTDQSSFSLAIRRNCSNIACGTLGATLLMNISGQKVARSEVKTAAALLTSMKDASLGYLTDVARVVAQHFEDASPGISLAFKPAQWTLYTLSFRSDATNSSIWKRECLHVVDTSVSWVSNTSAARRFDAENLLVTKRCLWGCSVV